MQISKDAAKWAIQFGCKFGLDTAENELSNVWATNTNQPPSPFPPIRPRGQVNIYAYAPSKPASATKRAAIPLNAPGSATHFCFIKLRKRRPALVDMATRPHWGLKCFRQHYVDFGRILLNVKGFDETIAEIIWDCKCLIMFQTSLENRWKGTNCRKTFFGWKSE